MSNRRDERLMLSITQLGAKFAGLADWYRRRGDFALMPGAEVLRALAAQVRDLADDLDGRADDIDGIPLDQRKPRPPVSDPPN